MGCPGRSFNSSFFKHSTSHLICAGKPLSEMLGGFPGGLEVKNLPASAGDMGLIPGLGRSHMLQSN